LPMCWSDRRVGSGASTLPFMRASSVDAFKNYDSLDASLKKQGKVKVSVDRH
jgi:hypothetical protein